MKKLLTLAAVIEAATGLALIVAGTDRATLTRCGIYRRHYTCIPWYSALP